MKRIWRTDDPLDPDDVVAIGLRLKVLQAGAEIIPHSRPVFTQIRPCFVQKALSHIHQVYGAKKRQQQTFGDAANSCAAI